MVFGGFCWCKNRPAFKKLRFFKCLKCIKEGLIKSFLHSLKPNQTHTNTMWSEHFAHSSGIISCRFYSSDNRLQFNCLKLSCKHNIEPIELANWRFGIFISICIFEFPNTEKLMKLQHHLSQWDNLSSDSFDIFFSLFLRQCAWGNIHSTIILRPEAEVIEASLTYWITNKIRGWIVSKFNILNALQLFNRCWFCIYTQFSSMCKETTQCVLRWWIQ